MKRIILTGVLLVLLDLLVAIPTDEDHSMRVKRAPEEDDDFPEFDDHTTEKPQSKGIVSRLGQMLNGILQIPISMFKAVNSFISNQSFSKLREEVRNLNISYPKTG